MDEEECVRMVGTGSRERARFFGSERPRQVLRYQPPANGHFLDRKPAVTRAPEATGAMPPSNSTFSQGVHRYGLPSLQDRDRERLAILPALRREYDYRRRRFSCYPAKRPL